VLARARMNRPRTPVFLIIDEFQFVADLPIIDTILSEARKVWSAPGNSSSAH
jgi:hypothetical protein